MRKREREREGGGERERVREREMVGGKGGYVEPKAGEEYGRVSLEILAPFPPSTAAYSNLRYSKTFSPTGVNGSDVNS